MSKLHTYIEQTEKAAPLAVFRILFGILMFVSILRFWYNGWIEKLYLDPTFHFHFYGFEWVQVPSAAYTYALFVVCALSALLVALGYKYRLASIVFFLSFTYIELMDKTTYLNHYYFISVLSFVMIFLPAHRYFSIDAHQNKSLASAQIPRWTIDVVKLLLGVVYFYAGIAKLNTDWLVNAMPLSIWLPTKFDTPLLGSLMHQRWMHYAFSWSGALYDLFIPFLLLWQRTRIWAFAAVVFFHVITRILFPIGMFPYIMIASTLIFFHPSFHNKVLGLLAQLLGINKTQFDQAPALQQNSMPWASFRLGLITVVVGIQLLFPWRFLLYPGNLFWTEQGFRFSWRVMLIEKTGYAQFKIVNGQTGKRFYVQNEDFLTAFQQKQMATQPDFIIEYAHYLGQHFASQGHENVEVYVESYVALNGRKHQQFIDPDVNLMTIENNLQHRSYVLPLRD